LRHARPYCSVDIRIEGRVGDGHRREVQTRLAVHGVELAAEEDLAVRDCDRVDVRALAVAAADLDPPRLVCDARLGVEPREPQRQESRARLPWGILGQARELPTDVDETARLHHRVHGAVRHPRVVRLLYVRARGRHHAQHAQRGRHLNGERACHTATSLHISTTYHRGQVRGDLAFREARGGPPFASGDRWADAPG
jgi:hypothetical protein